MKNLILSKNKYLILVMVLFLNYTHTKAQLQNSTPIITGADQTEKYLPLLKGKRVAIAANQTSVIFKTGNRSSQVDRNYTHLVDSLLSLQVDIVQVFSPEHGFRGKADAGEDVSDDVDKKTGLPIISLHGKTRKASPEMLKNVDIIVFDIQDVGVRFYTYISTMSNLMEAAGENNIPIIVLDRPNPNGHFVDGPMLETEHRSFVGMHPVPLVYGLTIGEYATMVNGEKWLKNGIQCDLTVIALQNYSHNSTYHLAIRPSPNLPNDHAINLYPGLGLLEGTMINAGRGTEFQFQRYGAPFFPKSDFSYTPIPNFGSKYPKFEGELCYGVDLTKTPRLSKVDISFLIDAYKKTPKSQAFFGKTFTIHAGNLKLRKQIEAGMTAKQIRASWQGDIKKFKKIRSKYLIYQ